MAQEGDNLQNYFLPNLHLLPRYLGAVEDGEWVVNKVEEGA